MVLTTEVFADYSPLNIDIIDDKGGVFYQLAVKNTSNRKWAYIEAKKGKRYGIKVTNISSQPLGFVIAVDGINIITRNKSFLGSNESMYILSPNETAVYKGWKAGKNKINRFFFTGNNNSYLNKLKKERKELIGVIAVAVFNGIDSQDFKPENHPIKKYFYKYVYEKNKTIVDSNNNEIIKTDIKKIKKELADIKEKLKTEKSGGTSLHWSDE